MVVDAELGSRRSQSVLVTFLLCDGEKLVFARLQIKMYGKVVTADRSVAIGIESVLTEKELASLSYTMTTTPPTWSLKRSARCVL